MFKLFSHGFPFNEAMDIFSAIRLPMKFIRLPILRTVMAFSHCLTRTPIPFLVILCRNFHATRSPIQAPNLVSCALLPVMYFRQACVKNSVPQGGGSASVHAGTVPPPTGRMTPFPSCFVAELPFDHSYSNSNANGT